jgi:putative acetyltransferase
MGVLHRFRLEEPTDIERIYDVEQSAFKRNDEAEIVNTIRGTEDCICSVVAESNGQIVGHCLFTRVKVVSGKKEFFAAALGPVAVIPDFQGEKIGTMMIITATNVVIDKGYDVLFVVGSPEYYNRFGYSDATEYGFSLSFEFSSGTFMVAGLSPDALRGKQGVVHYGKAFKELQ